MMLDFFIALALSLPATVYGLGERMCGQTLPLPCVFGAVTSSGAVFNPETYQAAVPAPNYLKIYPRNLALRAFDGTCVNLQILDRKNPRYIGISGLDLTPALVFRLTGQIPTRHWGARVSLCR